MQKTSSSEFVEWICYFNELEKTPKIEHYYLAQIASAIWQSQVKPSDRKYFKLKNFLFDFTKKEPKQNKKIRTAISKAFWYHVAKVRKKK